MITRTSYLIPSLSTNDHLKEYRNAIFAPAVSCSFDHSARAQELELQVLDTFEFPEFEPVLSSRDLSSFAKEVTEERLILTNSIYFKQTQMGGDATDTSLEEKLPAEVEKNTETESATHKADSVYYTLLKPQVDFSDSSSDSDGAPACLPALAHSY